MLHIGTHLVALLGVQKNNQRPQTSHVGYSLASDAPQELLRALQNVCNYQTVSSDCRGDRSSQATDRVGAYQMPEHLQTLGEGTAGTCVRRWSAASACDQDSCITAKKSENWAQCGICEQVNGVGECQYTVLAVSRWISGVF